MAKVNSSIQKKRGRGRPARPGGVDPVVPVRFPKPIIAAVDAWAKDSGLETRSAAIIGLVERGLESARVDAIVQANRAAVTPPKPKRTRTKGMSA